MACTDNTHTIVLNTKKYLDDHLLLDRHWRFGDTQNELAVVIACEDGIT